MGHWIRNDFTFGGTHLLMRVKTWHMFADLLRGVTEVPISYPHRSSLEKSHYKIKLNDTTVQNEIKYEKFDYNIIPPVDVTNNPFANSLVNEIWPFLRMLWKCRGGYEATILFKPELDLKEFGSQFGPGMFDATYKFTISDDGKWSADFDMKFDQNVENPYDDRLPPPEGRKGPFYAQDYSRLQSNTTKRARKLAKPSWSDEEGRNGQDFSDLLNEEVVLNSSIDFSFNLHYVGTGDWGNVEDYEVKVSDIKRDSLPEKEVMKLAEVQTISLDSIKTRKVSRPNTPA